MGTSRRDATAARRRRRARRQPEPPRDGREPQARDHAHAGERGERALDAGAPGARGRRRRPRSPPSRTACPSGRTAAAPRCRARRAARRPPTPVMVPIATTITPGRPCCSATCAPLIVNSARPSASADEQRAVRRPAAAHVEQRGDGGGEHDPEIGRVLDPEDRVAVEQQVAQRAAADRGHHGDHADADPVEALAARRERAARREHRHAEQAERVEDQCGLARLLVTARSPSAHCALRLPRSFISSR